MNIRHVRLPVPQADTTKSIKLLSTNSTAESTCGGNLKTGTKTEGGVSLEQAEGMYDALVAKKEKVKRG